LNKKETAFKDFNCLIGRAISFYSSNIIGDLF